MGVKVNAVIAIHPYKSGGLWVFDDDSVGLRQEPFIAGANVTINIPPVASLFKGDYAEITETRNRPPFERWCRQAKPI